MISKYFGDRVEKAVRLGFLDVGRNRLHCGSAGARNFRKLPNSEGIVIPEVLRPYCGFDIID
jgi:hypothetical protein